MRTLLIELPSNVPIRSLNTRLMEREEKLQYGAAAFEESLSSINSRDKRHAAKCALL